MLNVTQSFNSEIGPINLRDHEGECDLDVISIKYFLERKVFSCCCRVLVFHFTREAIIHCWSCACLSVWELENFKLKNDKYLVQWKTILKIFTFVCFVINSLCLCVCVRLFVYIINIFDRLKNRVMITLSVFKLGFYVSCLVTSD